MSEILPPNSWLHLRLFGGCEISLPHSSVHLETTKTRALLVYLALNPGPQARHTLMCLLWGELPETNARRNLRRALWNLRRQLAGPELPPVLLTDRETVCLNPEVPYWSDVMAFEAACSNLETTLKHVADTSSVDVLRFGVEFYQGEFLAGFQVGDAMAFEEWVVAKREGLRVTALRALQHLVAGYATHGENESALHCARRLLALEPWLEEGHRWMMLLLARMGRRPEALAHYDTCKRTLVEGLGVAPAQETQTLYKQIQADAFQNDTSSVPASTTPFVGRARELTEIAGLLADADCRLLSVTGIGGVGKTRLALEVAVRHVAAFPHGVHYVELGVLSKAERLASVLVHSLGISLVGAIEPKAALLTQLRAKEMLLVMDGFENLLEEAPLLSEMLQIAPRLRVLVTSRERLNLRGEWVYPLKGLALTPLEHGSDVLAFDAAQLFLQTARRVHLGFQVREGEQKHLVRICTLVAGLPLAIELAATWVRVMSLEAIVAEIEQHLDFLVAGARDWPERQRSLRAVFDQSWQRLSERERAVFTRLSVFRGSFRLQEAAQVSEASPSILAMLADKSLLQQLPSGRQQIHELLRQYAYEHLENIPDALDNARNAHCQAYAMLLAQHHLSSKSVPHHKLVKAIGADLENILTAWWRAVEQHNLEAVASMCQGLTDYFQLTSSFRDGEGLFREALNQLGWPEAGDGTHGGGVLLLWELLSIQAMFSLYLGQLTEARTSLVRCLSVFRFHGVAERVAHCQFFLAEVARFLGELHSARELYRESMVTYQQVRDQAAVGFCLNGLGLVASALGEMAESHSCFMESLAAFGETRHEMGQIITGINLADLLMKLEDHATAREMLCTAVVRCNALDYRWGLATCLRYLADIAELEGRVDDARRDYEKSLAILQNIGQWHTVTVCLIQLGRVCADLGQYSEARQYLKKALAIANDLRSRSQMVEAILGLALVLAREGKIADALELAILVELHAAGFPPILERGSQLVADLAAQVSKEDHRSIAKRAGMESLEGILAKHTLVDS